MEMKYRTGSPKFFATVEAGSGGYSELFIPIMARKCHISARFSESDAQFGKPRFDKQRPGLFTQFSRFTVFN